MSFAGVRYFNFAGPNDFVTFFRGGAEIKQGNGLAGLLMPGTSVSVVPLGIKTVPFRVTERTSNRQLVVVYGELVVENVPEMREHFDFSVFPENGQFRNDPTKEIEDQVRIAVRAPLRAKIAELTIEDVTAKGAETLGELLAEAVEDPNSALMKLLAANDIKVTSASVKSVEPQDADLSEAIGAEERQELLAAQDDAVADRRMQAAKKDREIRAFEEATSLQLVEAQAERVEKEGENSVKAAEADAKATEARIKPFADMDSGAVLAHAIMQAASEGGLGRLSLDPSLLAAVRSVAER